MAGAGRPLLLCPSHLRRTIGGALYAVCSRSIRRTHRDHACQSLCHQGPCPDCPMLPSKLLLCPCGKSKMKELLLKNKIIRTSCLDPVPVCDKRCERILHVTEDDEIHMCQQQCHTGDCDECRQSIKVKCRCGKDTYSVECSKSNLLSPFCLSELKVCNYKDLLFLFTFCKENIVFLS